MLHHNMQELPKLYCITFYFLSYIYYTVCNNGMINEWDRSYLKPCPIGVRTFRMAPYERTLARAVSALLLTLSERKAGVLHLDEALIMCRQLKSKRSFTLLFQNPENNNGLCCDGVIYDKNPSAIIACFFCFLQYKRYALVGLGGEK